MRELFIWYRVRDDRAEAALAALRAMQAALAARWPGLRPRLLTRRDGSGVQTWMETYSCAAAAENGQDAIDGDIDIEIEQAIEAAARPLAALLDGARHVEVFTAIDPP